MISANGIGLSRGGGAKCKEGPQGKNVSCSQLPKRRERFVPIGVAEPVYPRQHGEREPSLGGAGEYGAKVLLLPCCYQDVARAAPLFLTQCPGAETRRRRAPPVRRGFQS
jgi:hypothetical protein